MKIQKVIFKFKNLRKYKKIRKETKKYFLLCNLWIYIEHWQKVRKLYIKKYLF